MKAKWCQNHAYDVSIGEWAKIRECSSVSSYDDHENQKSIESYKVPTWNVKVQGIIIRVRCGWLKEGKFILYSI